MKADWKTLKPLVKPSARGPVQLKDNWRGNPEVAVNELLRLYKDLKFYYYSARHLEGWMRTLKERLTIRCEKEVHRIPFPKSLLPFRKGVVESLQKKYKVSVENKIINYAAKNISEPVKRNVCFLVLRKK